MLLFFGEACTHARNMISINDVCSSLVPDVLSSNIFCVFFSRSIFFVRPEGEAPRSAETCLFPHVAAFGGSGEVRRISLSLSLENLWNRLTDAMNI